MGESEPEEWDQSEWDDLDYSKLKEEYREVSKIEEEKSGSINKSKPTDAEDIIDSSNVCSTIGIPLFNIHFVSSLLKPFTEAIC